MTQLILDISEINLSLPESQRGGYACTPKPLYSDTEMASGRLTREFRKFAYTLSYQFGFLTDQEKDDFLEICLKGSESAITCAFLTHDSSNELIVGDFLVTSFTPPKFMWSRVDEGVDVPLWGDFKIVLREVSPHD